MKLLLHENLSRRLVVPLSAPCPGTTHVVFAGLERASDEQVWAYARDQGFVIVTKDDDFSALAALRGRPPQVIKLTLGNVDNATALAALIDHKETVLARLSETDVTLVELTSEHS